MKAALAKLNGQSLASKKLPKKEADPELVVYTIDSGVASFEPGADHRHTPRSAERCCLPCKCNPITKTIPHIHRDIVVLSSLSFKKRDICRSCLHILVARRCNERIDPCRAGSYNLCVPAALSFDIDLLG